MTMCLQYGIRWPAFADCIKDVVDVRPLLEQAESFANEDKVLLEIIQKTLKDEYFQANPEDFIVEYRLKNNPIEENSIESRVLQFFMQCFPL